MANIAKTVVATGCSSTLGFEAVKQLLEQTQPYRFILGCRNTTTTQAAYDNLSYDKKHSVNLLPLELADLRTVKSFATQTLNQLGSSNIDVLLLNAALSKTANEPGVNGSKWCQAYVVNSLSQHYLIHLLREKLVSSRSRIVIVSTGGVRGVKETSTLDVDLKANSGVGYMQTYNNSKFTQLLGVHYWRRQLPECNVLAVSPGLIPDTNLARYAIKEGHMTIPPEILKDTKDIPTGARSILAGFERSDFPEDPEQVFLTSWGEWWPKDVYGLTLDKALQEKFSPSKEEIEKEELVD